MPAFQPTADQFRAFRDDPYDGPIAQVNLLKFRAKARYRPDDPEFGTDEPGAAAYEVGGGHCHRRGGALLHRQRRLERRDGDAVPVPGRLHRSPQP